jgi:Ca2+-binding RTX toxin-like protein
VNWVNRAIAKSIQVSYVNRAIARFSQKKIKGTSGNDRLSGGSTNDKIDGKDGNDRLVGDEGNDYLEGGKGNDTLIGGNGNDLLKGGEGQDILMGGAGKDRFEIKYKSNKSGYDFADVVTDFQDGTDTLKLDDLKISDIAIVQGKGSFANDTLIQLAGAGKTLMVLQGVKSSLITTLDIVGS